MLDGRPTSKATVLDAVILKFGEIVNNAGEHPGEYLNRMWGEKMDTYAKD
jgi:hypothetical protein